MVRDLLRALAAVVTVMAGSPLPASAAARAADVVKVHMPVAGFETMPFLIANDLGFYGKQGIQLERHTMKTDIGVMALIGGQVDASQILGLSLHAAIQHAAIQRGADLRVAMAFNKLPSYSLFVRKPISSYTDLRGHRIASSSSGASATEILRITLRDHGMDPEKDISIFYVADPPTIYQSLLAGAVSAAVLTTPYDVAAATRPELQELPFANKPGVLMAGVAANTQFLYGRPDVAKRFLYATWQGLNFLISHRDETIQLMVKNLNIDEGTASKVYDRWVKRLSRAARSRRTLSTKC